MTPKEVVQSALNLSDEFLDNVRKESTPVVKHPGFEMHSANRTPQNVKYFKNLDYKVKNPPCNAAKEH